MKIQKNNNIFLLAVTMCAMAAISAGCLTDDQRKELQNTAHTAILEYVENQGTAELTEFIDQLVEEGKLGTANAEKIKAAIPYGIDKLKTVMGEIEQEDTDNE